MSSLRSALYRGGVQPRSSGRAQQPNFQSEATLRELLALRPAKADEPAATRGSRAHCDGPCCSEPLKRNRTCAFRDLLFQPPSTFYYLSDDGKDRSAEHGTFLHNRFAGSDTTGENSHSYFTPKPAPLSAALRVTGVIETPVYIGADLHSNQGHLMMDSTFPLAVSLLRLRASLAASGGSQEAAAAAVAAAAPAVAPGPSNAGNVAVATPLEMMRAFINSKGLDGELQAWVKAKAQAAQAVMVGRRLERKPSTAAAKDFGTLPDAVSGNFTFLAYDSPGYAGWHRGKRERIWAAQMAGRGVVDLPELASICPQGCIVRTSWVGAGHVGLCAVDQYNGVGGAWDHRALFRWRHRIYHMWKVPAGPLPLAAGGKPQVILVETKRRVTNLAGLAARINAEGFGSARIIRWENLPFAEQLRAMRGAAVQVSGVGSSQMNQFLLPRGSVAISLGWRDETSRHGVTYFDSHILRSMDHARVLYYPSYTRAERSCGHEAVCLDLAKATALVKQGVEIYKAGFATPLPFDANANKFDRAFTRLVELTKGVALQHRTADYAWGVDKPPVGCTHLNGVDKLLWSPTARTCMWSSLVPGLAREFDL